MYYYILSIIYYFYFQFEPVQQPGIPDRCRVVGLFFIEQETHLNKIKDLFAKMGAHESGQLSLVQHPCTFSF